MSEFLDKLSELVEKDQYSIHPDHLAVVSKDESTLTPVQPLAVVWALETDQIQSIVKLCNQFKVPITTRGAGSALEGSTIPSTDGIVLDLSRMTKVKQIWADDLQVEVEPGIIYDDLNNILKNDGLFFPPSPGGSGDIATVGGMVATNASGIYSVKYGGTKDYILSMEIVTGDGRKMTVGNRAIKRSSGYNLTELICGSEGTLVIVTSIILKLAGLPEGRKKTAYKFPDETSAARTVSDICRYGIDIAAIEYLDRHLMSALNKLKDYNIEVTPSLFLEFHGSDEICALNSELTDELCKDNNGEPLTLADNQNPWEIRHWATDAIKHYKPGYDIIRNDVAFPTSHLPEMVDYCYQKAEEYGITIFTFGHVGLGLLHALMLARKDNEKEWQKGLELSNEIIKKTVALGGTISGEHGIGLGHKDLFELEHGDSVNLMRSIKKQFDPNNILNPGKIFD